MKTEIRMGRPLEELLAASRTPTFWSWGRGASGAVERLVLGSVAEGAVSRAPVPVLVVR